VNAVMTAGEKIPQTTLARLAWLLPPSSSA
jgi:hypothetical protein